jgi:LuxR family maltose regulon positive regulatory protein
LKIIVAYHRPIPLRFGELLASGHLLLLEADNLRFTLEETCQVLTTCFSNDIDRESCDRLHELTKGWPLGVQLAVSTILKSGNLRSAIAGFSPRSGDMQRYFMEYLVDRLPPDAAAFLTEVSFLNRIHPDLCQCLTGSAGSGEMLTYLRDMTPIFQGAESGDWVRMLPIARDFLNERFEHLPHKHQADLHTRAASWLAEHEMLEEAAYHALLAGNEAYAFDLIERCLYDILSMGRMACVLEWINCLPQKEVERRPQIRLVAGWALAQSEKHAAAVELVGSLIEDPAAVSAERFEAAQICATAAFFADDIDRIVQLISQWREPFPYQTQSQRIGHTNLQAVGALFGGSPENANYLLEQLSDSAHSRQLSYISGWSDWISGFAYLWEGHVARAEEVLRASLWRAEETAGRRSPIAGMLSATLAAVLWERGLADEAGKLLVGCLGVLERHAPPDAIIHGYVTSARVAVESGHHDRAHDLLEHLRAIGDTRDLPRLCVASLAEEARMFALRNQENACTARLVLLEQLDEAASPRWGLLQDIVRPQIGFARVYAAIARHDWDAVSPELAIIDPLLKKNRRVREAIQVLLLQALAGKQRGDDVAAMLDEATSLAETVGLKRILIDTHPALAKIDHSGEREKNTEANSKLAPPVAAAPSKAQPCVAATALLTPKETEVLQLLAGNLSNKQIASALGVGDQTVKWHLKNMFGKLQAGNRKHLLGRARMLGILE